MRLSPSMIANNVSNDDFALTFIALVPSYVAILLAFENTPTCNSVHLTPAQCMKLRVLASILALAVSIPQL